MKKAYLSLGRSLLSLFAISVVGKAAAQKSVTPQATLKEGDMAPPAVGITWLKGQPLNNLADGTVHVVEFWATWCGPCIAAMPELSKLAAEYKGKVSFTGIDIWESHSKEKSVNYLPKVKEFVESAHAKMAYNVGADDPAGDMMSTWLTAAGQQGIPCTFVIDGDGRIAYIGHPIYLGEILPSVLNHTFEAKAFKVSAEAQMVKLGDINKEIDKATKEKDFKKVLDLFDESEQTFPWDSDGVAVKRYAILAVLNPSEAHQYGEKMLKRFDNSPQYLCYIARVILGNDDFNQGLGEIKDPDYPLALEAVTEAQNCSAPSDIFVNMTMADALFKNGNSAKAADYQAKVYKAFREDKALHAKEKQIAEQKAKLDSFKAADSKPKAKL
ncbi:MAG TPA: TlpA disulfide reductase family protein [Fimbriimonadaceae bacterium]|jgi:thiol-disulfide isomerase/thioredoxin